MTGGDRSRPRPAPFSLYGFLRRQVRELRAGGGAVWRLKAIALGHFAWRAIRAAFALPAVALIRALRPFVVVRIQPFASAPIGHLAANPDIYLSETLLGINVPKQRFWDVCYYAERTVANAYLASMWRRVLRIGPRWFVGPVHELNELLPGGAIHTPGNATRHNRDIYDAMERFPAHLRFTAEERARGEAALRRVGVPAGAKYVCLAARDGAYHMKAAPSKDFSYHDFRNVDIDNFVDAAEALAARGYYVIRIGSVVEKAISSSHDMVIDYATSGLRDDFLDIYLPAHCTFCLSVGTGIDSVPMVFRRPVAFVNYSVLAYLPTYISGTIFLSKRYRSVRDGRWLSVQEVFEMGAASCLTSACLDARGVELVENTPAEITEVAMEMVDRLTGRWQQSAEDQALQDRFWDVYPLDTVDEYNGLPLHGAVRALHSTQFLRDNPWWLA